MTSPRPEGGYPPHVYGDNLTSEDIAMGFGPWDVTDEGVQDWRDANSCEHINAGVACDGTCIPRSQDPRP